MVDVEGVGRLALAVWFDASGDRLDTLTVLGIAGDDSYLLEIDEANRERLVRDIVDNYDVLAGIAPTLRIEIAVFGKRGGFFASSMDFLERWPKSSAEVPADIFIDDHYKAAFTNVGDEIVVSVRHALRPSDGPPRRRLRFPPNEYEEAIAHFAAASRRIRDDLITAAEQRAPGKIGVLLAAFRHWPA